MERVIIGSMVASLSLGSSETGPLNDGEVWEEIDGGATFTVSLNRLPEAKGGLLSLAISGEPAERARVIDEFTAEFGPPSVGDVVLDVEERTDTLLWQQEEVA